MYEAQLHILIVNKIFYVSIFSIVTFCINSSYNFEAYRRNCSNAQDDI